MSNIHKSLGFVLMMDVSPSIADAIGMVIIDAKAFVREARAGDQFGVNRFSTVADWVYPTGTNPNIVTITEGLSEIQAATGKMDNVYPHQGWTNISQAISLANTMIAKANTDLKALVLISDGKHNEGDPPEMVLGKEPPIYIAGLGKYMLEEYFRPLIDKNIKKSHFYGSPDAIDMSIIFNFICNDVNNGNLALNKSDVYQKSSGEYFKHDFLLSDKDSRVNLGVVWSDKRCYYTPNAPSGYGINLVLRDPKGNKISVKPKFVDDGSCVIHLDGAMPGKWTLLAQHALKSGGIQGTSGVIDLDTTISSEIAIPASAKRNECVDLQLSLQSCGRDAIENATVQTLVSAPRISVDEALNRYEPEWKAMNVEGEDCDEPRVKLNALRMQKLREGVEIMPVDKLSVRLDESGDGSYKNVLSQTQVPGIYDVDIKIDGINPKTGFPFTRLERRSLFIK